MRLLKDIAPFCIFSRYSLSRVRARKVPPKKRGTKHRSLRAAKLFRKVAENLLARSGCNNGTEQQQNNTLKIMIVYGFT